MGRQELKKQVLTALAEGQIEMLLALTARHSPQILLAPLFSALCHPLAKVRNQAVVAFGILVPRMAETDLEAARVVMRRFLWSLNEESGGIGWGAPEAMARILGASSSLRGEYLHLLCSYMRGDGPELFQDGNYLELPLLQRGLLAGIGDLCRDFPEEMAAQRIATDLLSYLDSPDHQVVGLAIRCLGYLRLVEARDRVNAFLDHPGRVEFCEAGEERVATVGELVLESLARMSAGETRPSPATCSGVSR